MIDPLIRSASLIAAIGLCAGTTLAQTNGPAVPAERCAIGGAIRTAPKGFVTSHFDMPDGASIAVHRAGKGRTVVLLHGWLASSDFNWGRPGIAKALVDAGYHVVMVDHRGHGLSGTHRNGNSLLKDQLALDGLEVIRQLGLVDYDLVGYSIGGRTALRMVVNGAQPHRSFSRVLVLQHWLNRLK